MKYIKRFNESNSDKEMSEEIKQSINDCFIDFLTDHDMIIDIIEGQYNKMYNFLSDRFLKNLIKSYPKEKSEKIQNENEKCIKVNLVNEGIDKGNKLNININEMSQKNFDESLHNLNSQLKLLTNKFRLFGVPNKLSNKAYSITFLIIYE